AVQLTDAGGYAVTVTDQHGSQTTDPALLALNPLITDQPQNQSAAVGTGASFHVTAQGTGPLTYRWRHNGIILQTQTNSMLNLLSVQPADAGTYSVTVSIQTPLGRLGTLSSNATLTVFP